MANTTPPNITSDQCAQGIENPMFRLLDNVSVNISYTLQQKVEASLKETHADAIAEQIVKTSEDRLCAIIGGLKGVPPEKLLSEERMHEFTLAKIRSQARAYGLTEGNTVTFAEAVVASGKTAIAELSEKDIAYLKEEVNCNEVLPPSCPLVHYPDSKQR